MGFQEPPRACICSTIASSDAFTSFQDTSAVGMSAFGYVFCGEDSLGPDPQQLWADDELYRTLPQHTPYNPSSPQMNRFPCDVSCAQQTDAMLCPSPAPVERLSAMPYSEKAQQQPQPQPQPEPMVGVMPCIPQIGHQAIPAAQLHLHRRINPSSPKALVPILQTEDARDTSPPQLRWGSDQRLTIFGYSVPRGQVREEQVMQRLLNNSSLFILQFCKTAVEPVDGASEACTTVTGPVANSIGHGSCATSQQGDIQGQATDSTAISGDGIVEERPPHKRQKLENDMRSAKRRRAIANKKFEELQRLIPIRWIIQLQDEIGILKH
ncbi:hypothetical protein BJX66DRAFT_312763 [Aspergillus keveii]|uniref:BHLH domain-containing protein n=1 Tax=Aspergillus keveii TaxID=714993 RepID=A0ABR4FTC2_9EURO